MKPFLSALALAGAVVFSGSAFAQASLDVTDESGQVSTTVVVDVDYTSDGTSRGGDFTLDVDDTSIFSAISIECGAGDQVSGGLVNVCNYAAGTFDIGQANLSDPLPTGNLARLSFTIAGTATPGDVANIIEGSANNWQNGLTISAGSVTVTSGPVPNLAISSGNGAFGGVEVGSSEQEVFTLTNDGDPSTSLDITGITVADVTGGAFTQAGGSCTTSTSLATGQSCTVIVEYTPGDTTADEGDLDVTSTANNVNATLTGTGTAAQAVLDTSNTSFALVGENEGNTVSGAFRVANDGPMGTTLIVSNCSVDTDPSSTASVTPAGATLDGGESQSFAVEATSPAVGADYAVVISCDYELQDSDGVSFDTGTIDVNVAVSTRPAVIPTLGAFGLVLFSVLMGLIGLVVVRQRA